MIGRRATGLAAAFAAVLAAAAAGAQQGWAPTVEQSGPLRAELSPESKAVARPRPPAFAPIATAPAMLGPRTETEPARAAAPTDAIRRPAPAAPVPAADETSAPRAAAVAATPLPAMAPSPRHVSEAERAAVANAELYCTSVADAAVEARFARQRQELVDLAAELDKRMAALDTRTAELQRWVARRDEFSRRAHDGLLRIYGKMRADAAASQLAAMDEETAAAVLMKLDPRQSSTILNEMDPAKAARLSGTISGAGRIPPARPGGGRS